MNFFLRNVHIAENNLFLNKTFWVGNFFKMETSSIIFSKLPQVQPSNYHSFEMIGNTSILANCYAIIVVVDRESMGSMQIPC